MRITAMLPAVACFALSLGLPARAAQPTLMDNYAAATQSFMGGLVDNRQWTDTYRNHVLAGIGGDWLPLSLVQPGSIDEIKKVCAKAANKITQTSPYSFKMDRRFSKDVTLDYAYTVISGNTFAEYVDVGKLIGLLGLDNSQVSSARGSVLASANGHLAIFRPTEDILVLQYTQRPPIIYGKCP